MRLYNSDASGNCYKLRLMLSLLGREYDKVELDVIRVVRRRRVLIMKQALSTCIVLDQLDVSRVSPGEPQIGQRLFVDREDGACRTELR